MLADPVHLDLRLPNSRKSVAAARHSVGGVLDNFVPNPLLETVQLLVSELVTNSLRHAGLSEHDWVHVLLHLSPEILRVEVTDPGKGFNPPERADDVPEQMSGWGLVLVERLSKRWGVDINDATKVWFELDGEIIEK